MDVEVVEISSLGTTTMKARKNQVLLQAEEEEEAEEEAKAEVVVIFLIFSVTIAIILAILKHIAG